MCSQLPDSPGLPLTQDTREQGRDLLSRPSPLLTCRVRGQAPARCPTDADEHEYGIADDAIE